MKSEAEVRQALRAWILKTSGKIKPDDLTDETPIIERRIISSLQIMDLILFLEQMMDRSLDVEQLKPGVFRSISVIYRNFFEGADDGR
jgi:acyl carrier protein